MIDTSWPTMIRSLPVAVVCLAASFVSVAGVRADDAAEGAATAKRDGAVIVRVTGEVEKPLELTAAALAGMKRVSVSALDHGNVRGQFEGVPLHEILKEAGAPVGDRLRGEAMRLVVIVGAEDSYQASFGLAELDPAFTDNVAILADMRDGKPMESPQGPLRVIVPHEKKHGRWVRMVTSITVARPAAAER